MRAKHYTGAGPRLSKAKTAKLKKAGIVLRRNSEGGMYFRCSYRGRFSTFNVTKNGEKWLQSLRYEEGHHIDRHIVQDLHDFGYIQNLDAWLSRPTVGAAKEPSPPARQLTPEESRRIKQQRREEHERRTLENRRKKEARLRGQAVPQAKSPKPPKQKRATPSRKKHFDWSAAVRVDERLGHIRSTTQTIHTGLLVVSSPDIDQEKD